MKKSFFAVMLLLVACFTITVPSQAHAATYFNNGLWWGNVCRTGIYYSFTYFQPVGASCWNSAWGVSGVITNE